MLSRKLEFAQTIASLQVGGRFSCSPFFRAELSDTIDISVIKFFTYYSNKWQLPFTTLKSTSLNVKLFVHNNSLYTDFGFSHYCLLLTTSLLRIVCTKKTIRLFSAYLSFLHNYIGNIFRLKKFSVYKTKGLRRINRVDYLKPRVGKKQQV